MTVSAPLPRSLNRGSAAITMLLMMVGLLGILGLVEIGYLYYAKRDLQKVVDLAAIAGAQRLETCNAALSDNQAARSNAVNDNGFNGSLTIRCGVWDPANGNVVSTPGAGGGVDAVQVDASKPAIPFFGQAKNMPMVRARAIARSGAPLAAFSIGSRLLDINANAPLQGLLRGIGLDLSNTEVASFRGLAQVKITPRGLLEALGIPVSTNIGVGELNDLLAARQVRVGDLLSAVASIGNQQGLANVDVGLLRNRLAQIGLDAAQIHLGSAPGISGLFARLDAGSAASRSALDLDLDALSLATTAIEIANSKHAVAIPGLNLLGAVEAKASVIEPPSIAIGPVGTTAYNSQVRLKLDIDTDRTLVLGSVLKLLGIRVHLPIYIDVVDGYGVLEEVNCTSTPAYARIGVTSTVANVCIGKATTPWDSTSDLCATGLQKEKLIKLLGINVLEHQIKLGALSQYQQLQLGINETGTVSPNNLALGTLVSNLTDALLGTLSALFNTPNGSTPDQNAKMMASVYLDATKDPNGFYNADQAIVALQNGTSTLPGLGTWTVQQTVCPGLGLVCHKESVDVWTAYKKSLSGGNGGVLGGLLDVVGLSACSGLLTALTYNTCLENNLATFLKTKPGGLQDMNYDPVSNTGACGSVLCLLLKPVVDGLLRPLLNGVGSLLGTLLSDVLGINLGRSVVTVHDIQCGSAELVF